MQGDAPLDRVWAEPSATAGGEHRFVGLAVLFDEPDPQCLLDGFGLPASYGRLREACQTDVDGTSIDTLEDLANDVGLIAEQILLPIDHLLASVADVLPGIVVVRQPGGLLHFVVAWRRHGPLVQGRRQMWELIGKLNTEHGTTIIWTSHYIEEIERNCTRILLLDAGRLVRDQPPGALVAEFGTASALVGLPDPADRARLLASVPAEYATPTGEHTLRLSGPSIDTHLVEVVSLVREAAGRGATIEFRAPSLEDAYVALVGDGETS